MDSNPGKASKPTNPLDGVFKPRSVAVIGASRREGSIGHKIFINLLDALSEAKSFLLTPRLMALLGSRHMLRSWTYRSRSIWQ